jgi:hypothetical protein
MPNAEDFLTVGRYPALTELNQFLTIIADRFAVPSGQRQTVDMQNIKTEFGVDLMENSVLLDTFFDMLGSRPEVRDLEIDGSILTINYNTDGLEQSTAPDRSDEEPSVMEDTGTARPAIPVKVMTESQPLVTVMFSEHDGLRGIEKMPLYLANTVFFDADEKQQADYLASGRPSAPYLNTDFRVDYTLNGKPESYTGRYDVGDGDQTILDHILGHAEYYRHDEGHQRYLADKGGNEQAAVNARHDFVIEKLVPFLEKHCEISHFEAAAISECMGIYEEAKGQPSSADAPRIAYLESVVEHAWRCRSALNETGLVGLPEAPPPFGAAAKNTTTIDTGEKPSVMDAIKAARQSPADPVEVGAKKHNRNKGEPDL